jgi:hypothetical protein
MKAIPARESQTLKAKPGCEALSHLDEYCHQPAFIFCDQCDRWFCAAHAQDDHWHACLLAPGEEGGEG